MGIINFKDKDKNRTMVNGQRTLFPYFAEEIMNAELAYTQKVHSNLLR